MDKTEKIFLIIAIIGLFLSAYAITLHYMPAGSSFCNIGESFDCDKVNKSPWSTFLGVPVALIGASGYFVLFLAVLKKRSLLKTLAFTEKDFWNYIFVLTAAGFAFQLYLTIVEFFFLHAYCIVCLGSQACILALTILAWKHRA